MMKSDVGCPVVAGIDGTEDGARAAMYAAQLAAGLGRSLLLVHAYRQSPAISPILPLADARAARMAVTAAAYAPYASNFSLEMMRMAGERAIRQAEAAVHADHPELTVRHKLVVGSASRTLIKASAKAVAVVVAKRQLNVVERFFAGSTSSALAAHAASPVIVVPVAWSTDSAARRIVVGLDGARSEVDAIQFAYDSAARSTNRLVVVHSCRSIDDLYRGIPELSDEAAELEAADRRAIAESLAGWSEEFPQVDVTTVFSARAAADALLHEAESAELLVVGSRGRGGFKGLRLGSVARTVLSHARCPVAVIHSRRSGRRHDFDHARRTETAASPPH
jgi:nucleotide-binding universal stress UspA family protein